MDLHIRGTRAPCPVLINAGRVVLHADYTEPGHARAVVVFAHGSGSGRHSPRNRSVALAMQRAGYATLLLDLLSMDEEAIDAQTRHLRFDVELLAGRLIDARRWLEQSGIGLPVAYFGASTGAAAALIAAGREPSRIAAIVSRGGRPDLAGDALPKVKAPTLLLVGEWDDAVVRLNEQALEKMRAQVVLEIVPRATHLFEEPGALEDVSRRAISWFDQHIPARRAEEQPSPTPS